MRWSARDRAAARAHPYHCREPRLTAAEELRAALPRGGADVEATVLPTVQPIVAAVAERGRAGRHRCAAPCTIRVPGAAWTRCGRFGLRRLRSVAGDGRADPRRALPGGVTDVTTALNAAVVERVICRGMRCSVVAWCPPGRGRHSAWW